ncbi:MAG: hypothetical protein ACRD0A_00645 [Acidimicrobiales bacterium]
MALLGGLIAIITVGGVAIAMQSDPTYGPIPEDAMAAGAAVDLSRVPDLVAVSGPDGSIAGYVWKHQLFLDSSVNQPASPEQAAASSGTPQALKVYDDRGVELVGYWVTDRGFVSVAEAENGAISGVVILD